MTTTGTPEEWGAGALDEHRVLGWAAFYWNGQGSVNRGDLYVSEDIAWAGAIYTPDPEDLPLVDLQIYLLFYRRNSHMYCCWLDGVDEFWLWNKTEMVTGTMLPDNKWNQMQNRARQVVWDHRGQFKRGIVDWLNEVPE